MTEENVKSRLKKAMNDYKTAAYGLRLSEDEIITDTVCFHCQQAAEKLLKSFLVSRNVDFGRTHNINFLIKLCVEQDDDFKELDAGRLTEYAVIVRYPDEFYEPSVEEAKDSLEKASKIKDFVFKKIGIDEKDI